MNKLIILILISILLIIIIYTNKHRDSFVDNDRELIALIVRCKDEQTIDEFVSYYINQGIDRIFILDDNSDKKSIYNNILEHPQVTIYFDRNARDSSVTQLYKEIKDSFEWIGYIDVDEYIATRKNIKNTIRDELLTTFKDVDCIKIPWVMMSFNNIEKTPKSILETNIYRWNHNKKHINKNHPDKFTCRYNQIQSKCIFKTSVFDDLFDHYPTKPNKKFLIVSSLDNKPTEYSEKTYNLRENDIENAFMVCYHYRIMSLEQAQNKIKTNRWYKKFKLEDLISVDYPEIIDLTMRNKSVYLK